jgi:putative flavoprotein involved in K+ transport
MRGVTDYDGLYFLGMPWLHSRRSGILFGVGDDAAYIAQHIGTRIIPAGFLSETWQGRAAQE